jgi:uncharacterized protein
MEHAFLPSEEVHRRLASRLGRIHAQQRLGIETDHESHSLAHSLTVFHIENVPYSRLLIEGILRLSCMFSVGVRNATLVEVRTNEIVSDSLPLGFDGFTILHLSDLHTDLNPSAMNAAEEKIRELHYDICVLTGDYRGQTWGDYRPCLQGLLKLRNSIKGEIYAVLGNHDSIMMVPDLEDMGINVLLNEHTRIHRTDAAIYLVGIDDAHFYRVDNVERAAEQVPEDAFSLLLSHTPEIYKQAAHAGFNLMLCGHTHGGQICLPGEYPVILEAAVPRWMGRGAWKYKGLTGYTSAGAGCSLVPVRFNCPPEITLHRLKKGLA